MVDNDDFLAEEEELEIFFSRLQFCLMRLRGGPMGGIC